MQVAKEPYLSQLITKIKPDMEELRNSGDFGVKIYNKLAKQYPDLAISGIPLPKSPKKRSKNKGKQGKKYKKMPTKP